MYKFFTVLNNQVRLFKEQPRVKYIDTQDGKEAIYICDHPTEPYGFHAGAVAAEDCCVRRPITSRTLQGVVTDLKTREKTGFAKYGTTVDRTDLGLDAWLQHLYEELLDAAMYIKRLKFFEVVFTGNEYKLMLELYENLPAKFTRSDAATKANELKIDPAIAGRLLKNDQLFDGQGVWFRKREL